MGENLEQALYRIERPSGCWPLAQPIDELVAKIAPDSCDQKPLPSILRLTAKDAAKGCDYCYVFEDYDPHAPPAIMTLDEMHMFADRAAEHADAHKLSVMRVILHGGEPLLFPRLVDKAAGIFRKRIESPSRKVGLSITTNGSRLTPEIVEMLIRHEIGVALSVDGGRDAHNRHRRDSKGQETWPNIERAVRLFHEAGMKFAILGVIDPRNDPVGVIEDLAALGPSSINLFPSLMRDIMTEGDPSVMSLGEWQKIVFEYWNSWGSIHPEHRQTGAPFSMPRFEDWAAVMMGHQAEQQNVGGRAWQEMFMYPGGKNGMARWGRIDTLAPGARGVHLTRFGPAKHSIDQVLKYDPGYIAQRGGLGTLPLKCRACYFRRPCGGDYHPHRGIRELLAKLTDSSTPEDYAAAYGNVSPLCETSQKPILTAIEKAVAAVRAEREAAAAPGTGERESIAITVPDDISSLVDSSAASAPPWLLPIDHRESLPYLAPRSIARQGIYDSYDQEQSAMINRLLAQAPNDLYTWLLDLHMPYEAFPLGDAERKRQLPEPYIDYVLELIKSSQLYGKLAAQAYKECLQQRGCLASPNIVAFHGLPCKASEAVHVTIDPQVHFGMAEYHYSTNDALVTALINDQQPSLRNTPFKLQKVNGYWITNGHAIRAMAARAASVKGCLVSTLGAGGRQSILRPLVTRDVQIIDVGFIDIPPELLVLDTPGATINESLRYFDEVAEMLPLFPNPEQLSKALCERTPHPLFLRPFAGPWPSRMYCGKDWEKREPAGQKRGRVLASA